MATVATALPDTALGARQTGSPLARAIDRWIYVFMAVWFMAITVLGFMPFTIARVAANRAGAAPPFPPILHVHAIVMAMFLLLLLAQTVLVAMGRNDRHQWLGRIAMVLVPAMVVVMIVLVPTSYHISWSFAQTAPQIIRDKLLKGLTHDNTLLLQIRGVILFPLFVFIALRARRNDPALHKRMMFLGTAILLTAATARMHWLPRPFGGSFRGLDIDLYLLPVVSPMLIWDVIRTRGVPKAYLIWGSVYALASIPVYALWGTPWWLSMVPHLMRV